MVTNYTTNFLAFFHCKYSSKVLSTKNQNVQTQLSPMYQECYSNLQNKEKNFRSFQHFHFICRFALTLSPTICIVCVNL